MARNDETRLRTLEQITATLSGRVAALEAQLRAAAPAVEATPPAPIAPATAAHPEPATPPAWTPPAARAPRPGLEDLIGGRVLAWTGGLAMLLGVALLLAIAVSNGWIGEGARTLMAGLISISLIGAGAWLQERRRLGDVALATVAAGIAGLFTTVAVGGPVYGVLPVPVALALAIAAGAIATVLAIRWEARGIGALGIVGALAAPILAGAPSTGATLALLWIAGLSAVAVLVWQRWNWLALAVFAISAPQWAWWLSERPSTAAILLVFVAFGALYVGAAVGFELRVPSAKLRPSAALLLTLNALVLALGGWAALEYAAAPDPALAKAWVVALAVVHLAVGLLTASTRCNRDVRLLTLALGVVLADAAAGLLLEGAVLAITWAVATAGFAVLARRLLVTRGHQRHDELLLGLGLGGHLLLSALQAVLQAPPAALAGGGGAEIAFAGHAAIAVFAAAAFVAGRFAADVRREWRVALDVAAMAGVAYLTAITFDGPVLAAAFAAQALALGTIAARGRDVVAAYGGAAFLGLALLHALAFEAPPTALVTGLDDLTAAALALGAIAFAALRGAHLLQAESRTTTARRVLLATGALTLLYLASTALVTPFQPGEGAPSAGLLDLGVRQLGQALLSTLWAICGLTALVIGLRRDERPLRLAALTLLGVTIGKVFLFDLATLTSLYRVASFIGLGLLLLVAAGVWQRMRPRPLPDLRATPPALR